MNVWFSAHHRCVRRRSDAASHETLRVSLRRFRRGSSKSAITQESALEDFQSSYILRRIPLNNLLWAKHIGDEFSALLACAKRLIRYWETFLDTERSGIGIQRSDDQGLYDLLYSDLEFLLLKCRLTEEEMATIHAGIPDQPCGSDLLSALDSQIAGSFRDGFIRSLSEIRRAANRREKAFSEEDPTALFSLMDPELDQIERSNNEGARLIRRRLGLDPTPDPLRSLQHAESSIEKALRRLVVERLDNDLSLIPSKAKTDIVRRWKKSANACTDGLVDQRLSEVIDFTDLGELQSILKSSRLREKFEDFEDSLEKLELRIEMLKDFRNDIAHHRTPSEQACLDARASVCWIGNLLKVVGSPLSE